MLDTDRGQIVKTVKDLLYTYDVTDQHYCINTRPNTLKEIYQEVRKQLEPYSSLMADVDYFSYGDVIKRKCGTPEYWPEQCHWTKVYYVTGGSEGYYIHVEADDTGKLQFLLKCWHRETAEALTLILARIFEV